MYGSIYPELQIEARMSNTTTQAPLTSYLFIEAVICDVYISKWRYRIPEYSFFISAAKSLQHKATGLHSLCLK